MRKISRYIKKIAVGIVGAISLVSMVGPHLAEFISQILKKSVQVNQSTADRKTEISMPTPSIRLEAQRSDHIITVRQVEWKTINTGTSPVIVAAEAIVIGFGDSALS